MSERGQAELTAKLKPAQRAHRRLRALVLISPYVFLPFYLTLLATFAQAHRYIFPILTLIFGVLAIASFHQSFRISTK